MLEEIVRIVKGLVGNDYLYFGIPVVIERQGVGIEHFSLWAVAISPEGKVYVMTSDEQWYETKEGDVEVKPLHEKILSIEKEFIKNSNS